MLLLQWQSLSLLHAADCCCAQAFLLNMLMLLDCWRECLWFGTGFFLWTWRESSFKPWRPLCDLIFDLFLRHTWCRINKCNTNPDREYNICFYLLLFVVNCFGKSPFLHECFNVLRLLYFYFPIKLMNSCNLESDLAFTWPLSLFIYLEWWHEKNEMHTTCFTCNSIIRHIENPLHHMWRRKLPPRQNILMCIEIVKSQQVY